MKSIRLIIAVLVISFAGFHVVTYAANSREVDCSQIGSELEILQATAGDSREFTWWFPDNSDAFVLPISAGIEVKSDNSKMMRLLQLRSPWQLKELPVVGARYGDRMLVVIVPWPHYAELIVKSGQLGISFKFPADRNNVTPCDIIAQWAGVDALEPARVFRMWRETSDDIGGLNRPRPLSQKINDFSKVERLLGAPHFYLWGPAMFSKHDVPRQKWVPLAKALSNAPEGSFKAKIRSTFSEEQRNALKELAGVEWPQAYLTVSVAKGIENALVDKKLLDLPSQSSHAEVVSKNRIAIANELKSFVRNHNNWGDGLSVVLFNELKSAGIEQAVLTLSDLYGAAVRPDVSIHAEKLGYLVGPYDSYHSVHSPEAGPDDTWETAQFDMQAYTDGRVIKEQGRRQGGFKGRGYHFSPEAAWPYVQERVANVLGNNGYSSWFIDCDATGECFDDYNPLHPATRVDDTNIRRDRLQWLEKETKLVVGSEGGASLFADVIHFGHGVHTPYIGHLYPGFRNRESKYFLGRHWPPDMPEQSFKPIDAPQELITPYFDPTLRIPLYQAAFGDELVATHHWSFDSLKFKNIQSTRALFEILYMVPPMYHINRESFPIRKDTILHHVNFWSPVHKELAEAPLVKFERLSEDGLVQQTTYDTKKGLVTITVNFGTEQWENYPGESAIVGGDTKVKRRQYRVKRP